MKRIPLITLWASAFLVGIACQAKQPEVAKGGPPAAGGETLNAPRAVKFTTDDGWEIAATYWPGGKGARGAAVLVHMLPADRRSYDDFGVKLAAAGFSVLALDSRGHGESLKHKGGTERYTEFGDAEHRASVGDIAAAVKFLADEGADTTKLALVGASIGANLALNYAAGAANVRAVALLSPGLDYHGVKTEEAMKKYAGRAVYLVASDEDGYAAESVTKLRALAPGAEYKMFSGAGHGTNIFKAEPAFEETLVSWLSSRVE